MEFLFTLTALAFALARAEASSNAKPPHILLIVADDYGWSDVGYHGSVIKTPNLDQLSHDGLRLENYYVQPICTPTRSALMSGRYPIHTGMQHDVIHPRQPFGLPTNFTLLPQRLKESGYRTHIVGKWHLGFFAKPYLPLERGFDSFFGFLDGSEDHNTHKVYGFLDFRDGKEIATGYDGVYSVRCFMKVSTERYFGFCETGRNETTGTISETANWSVLEIGKTSAPGPVTQQASC